jgi:hypothetical protein
MRLFLAARAARFAACLLFVLIGSSRAAVAQTWNDPRSRSLVEGATQRRAEQLADTALRDYQATAHGYVAFLAQLGEGFRTPPKVVKADELELEVYWRAPNLSKQRIIGRRDTLLLPTDIAYHMDHLGIVQNNFPDVIRIGEGDEVADVPHPLSAAGLREYDFALADSFAIGSGSQRIQVYEVKVRPKDDRQPRIVGAVYIDRASSQVVRMNFIFTRAALIDKALEELSVVLENRLVGGRFWLPSRQELELVRAGEWLDYPARGIIRGRWEIGDYRFNQSLPAQVFTGPEIVQAPVSQLAQHVWTGAILDSMPPDVRAVSEEDIARVQAEARALVRARALSGAARPTLAARSVSDFARFNRVEGLALGGGVTTRLGAGVVSTVRARYGIDDKQVKGNVDLSLLNANGGSMGVFAMRDFRELGDFAERSGVVNSLAAQEFGSDYTDPYLVRGVGARAVTAPFGNFDGRLTATYERQTPLTTHARPVTGAFERTIPVPDQRVFRLSAELNRAPSLWIAGTELAMHAELRGQKPATGSDQDGNSGTSVRGSLLANIERPFGSQRLVTSFSAAYLNERHLNETEEVYLGGPVSAPGYDFHSLIGTSGVTAHVEWRMPAPFPAFSLGRYGKVPARATFAPYFHVAAVSTARNICVTSPANGSLICPQPSNTFPALGAAYLLPFDLLRIDVARGVGRTGRWTFGVDVSREFWSIL